MRYREGDNGCQALAFLQLFPAALVWAGPVSDSGAVCLSIKTRRQWWEPDPDPRRLQAGRLYLVWGRGSQRCLSWGTW